MVTQVELARALNLDVSTVNKILNRKPGMKFRPETIEKVMRLAQKNRYDFSRIKFRHRRRHERKAVDRRVKVTIRLADGTMFDQGHARIRDVSPGGARLGGFRMKKGVLPIRPFQFMLELEEARLDAVPVRIIENGDLDIGVAFCNVGVSAQRRLNKVLS